MRMTRFVLAVATAVLATGLTSATAQTKDPALDTAADALDLEIVD